MVLGFIRVLVIRRALFYSAEAAATRGLYHEYVAGRHFGLVERSELGATSVTAQYVIISCGAGLAARHAVRAHQAMARENRRGHRLEKAHAAHRAVPAAPVAAAARSGADLEALEAHREAPLEHLGISEARIGHVRLHHVGTVEVRSGARAARNGLVVLVALIPEREIVHGALRGREHAEGAIERVGDALRGLDVPRDHGCGVARTQHAAFWNRNAERLEAARVERDVVVDQRAEYVQHCRHAHG